MTSDEHRTQESNPVIYRYTRAQAIDDGVLVDLTAWARETGFTIPVVCTSAVWHQYVVPPDGTRPWGQSQRGRAHDLLWMCYLAIRKANGGQDQLLFKVIFLNAKRKHETVTLKVICGPDDPPAYEPVLTILQVDED